MYIAYTIEDKTLVASIALGVTPEQAAFARGLAPGSWRVITEEEAAELQKPTPDEEHAAKLAAFTEAIQKHLDTFAQTRGYDGILSAATYATSSVPKFAAEGQYAVHARDATWARAYEILALVEAGEMPEPGIGDLPGMLPELMWPDGAVPVGE